MFFLLRIPDVWGPGRTYAKVIGPNLFRTLSTVRLKTILQLLYFLQPRCAGPRARPRALGRRAQPHTTTRPPAAPSPTRSRTERPHAYAPAAAYSPATSIARAPCMVYMAAKRGAAARLRVGAGVGGGWGVVVRGGRARGPAHRGSKIFSGCKIIFKRTVPGVLKRFGPITFAYVRPGSHTSGFRDKKYIVSRNRVLVVFERCFRRYGSPLPRY